MSSVFSNEDALECVADVEALLGAVRRYVEKNDYIGAQAMWERVKEEIEDGQDTFGELAAFHLADLREGK